MDDKRKATAELRESLKAPISDELRKALTKGETMRVEAELYAIKNTPVYAIALFLECFDSEGQQAREVPSHILAFLQERFQAFMRGGIDCKSIDEAFGGSVAMQRKAIEQEDEDFDIVSHLMVERSKNKKKRPPNRGATYGAAHDTVAETYIKSDHAIHDANKRVGRRGPVPPFNAHQPKNEVQDAKNVSPSAKNSARSTKASHRKS